MTEHAAGRNVDDWITIWQSELSAAATDRERAQAWSSLAGAWADFWRLASAVPPRPGAGDGTAGPAAAVAPAGPAPADDASLDDRAGIDRLAARVAELERRMASPG